MIQEQTQLLSDFVNNAVVVSEPSEMVGHWLVGFAPYWNEEDPDEEQQNGIWDRCIDREHALKCAANLRRELKVRLKKLFLEMLAVKEVVQ